MSIWEGQTRNNDGRISFDEYRRARNDYYTYIRRAKRLAWESFLEGVFQTGECLEVAPDPARCWQALKYTKPQVTSYTPAIKVVGTNGLPGKVAATAEEKEEIFMAQAFPPQAVEIEDTPIPDTSAGVSAKQVREALEVVTASRGQAVPPVDPNVAIQRTRQSSNGV
jgi:hypothetical protein